ncbi:hypothetical protein pb186bvf_009207 [Paramecium bursaria]
MLDEDSNQLSTSQFIQLNTPLHNENSDLEQLANNTSLFNDQSQQYDQDMQDDIQEISEAIATAALSTNDEAQAQNQVRIIQIEQETIKANKTAQYGKNAAKSLGNYLRKHITKRNLTHIPQLANFANKKERNKQAKYTIEDWKEMMLNNNEHQTQCREIVLEYLQNWAYVDILLEYKQKNPIEMIEHIQHFMSGCKDPANFICNKR